MEELEQGQCGVCYIIGPLREIETHFMTEHVDDNVEPHHSSLEELSSLSKYQQATSSLPIDKKCDEIRWIPEHVLLLIRLVEQNEESFEKGLKKAVWIKIASELSNMTEKTFTYEQVDNKWKGLKKTYKSIKDHNNKSGNTLKKWQFYSAMDSFMGKKPEVEAVATCSSISDVVKRKMDDKENELKSEGISSVTKRRKKISEVESRHKEKMTKYEKFLKLFQLSVEAQLGHKIELSDDSD